VGEREKVASGITSPAGVTGRLSGGTQLQIPEALKHYAVAQQLIVSASADILKQKRSSKLKEMLSVTTVS